jgi:hypothetical protein
VATHEVALAAVVTATTPRLDLHYLCCEIVRADRLAFTAQRHAQWERGEWWLAYGERLHAWHWWWVRHEPPQNLHRCPRCGRIHQNTRHTWLTCFACGESWLDP